MNRFCAIVAYLSMPRVRSGKFKRVASYLLKAALLLVLLPLILLVRAVRSMRKGRRLVPSWGSVLMLVLWLGVLGAIGTLSFFIYLQQSLPDPETIVARQVKESTKIYDRTGEKLLYDIYGEERRTVIPWEEIPLSIRQATLAAEDSDFYEHKGLDWKGIARAFLRNIQSADISQGGSTITQQLIKKALLTDERTVSRKLRELILSVEIEKRFSKDQILWMYLNQIPYGSNAYGIESASRTFFGVPASELTFAQSALLSSVANAPSYYSPYGKHADELLARKDLVLTRMKDLGYLSAKDLEAALKEKLEYQPNIRTLSAPHFVIMAREYLIKKYGQDIVESGGFKITTTLDAELQDKAEKLVSSYAKTNKEKYKASNAALVAIDPKTGDVVALIGSANYFDVESEGNFNVATAKRQPGSSFKPFAYAAAFQKGYPDYTMLFDVKTEFNPNCPADVTGKKDKFGTDCYAPQNYDGTFRGPVTLRQSLAQSLNIPSVKTLYLAGVEDTIVLAEKMGITTLGDRSRFGLSLVLGGAEVRLVDLVSAYGVFATEGTHNPWAFIQKIELSDGTVLEERKHDPVNVLDAQTARLISDVLADNNARAPVFGYNSPLYVPGRDVAVKTGTTQENRDAWTIGYTPSLVVGVWAGNNDNSPMTKAGAGISAAGPLWHDFITQAIADTPAESFTKPDPVLVSKIMLNGNYRYQKDEFSLPEIHTILHYVDRKNPLGGFPADPAADSQYQNWEAAVRTNSFSYF